MRRDAEAFCHRPGMYFPMSELFIELASYLDVRLITMISGEPCSKVKRAAEAIAEAHAAPKAEPFCHRPGMNFSAV